MSDDLAVKLKAIKSALDLGALTQDQYDAAEQRITSEYEGAPSAPSADSGASKNNPRAAPLAALL